MTAHYELLDSGDEKKLERFGAHILERPCYQAIWKPQDFTMWEQADYIFSRQGKNQWKKKGKSESWEIEFEKLKFILKPTEFGHIGLFPEHRMLWTWMTKYIQSMTKEFHLLNLFAYTGSATLAAAKSGAHVCHVDASKKSVEWAKENAQINQLEGKPIRWIVDDALKFLKREVKRGRHYDGILMDPPSFGRGPQGQLFKIEEHLIELLELCYRLLEKQGKFLMLSCHTPGLSPLILERVVRSYWKEEALVSGEMVIDGNESLPCGSFVRWVR